MESPPNSTTACEIHPRVLQAGPGAGLAVNWQVAQTRRLQGDCPLVGLLAGETQRLPIFRAGFDEARATRVTGRQFVQRGAQASGIAERARRLNHP